MTSRANWLVAFSALLVSGVIPARSMAQPALDEFASDHFIVKILEGVEPTVLAGGLLSFTYGQDAGQPPQAGVAELFIAGLLGGCGATAIEPLIHVELEGEVLALATEIGVMRQYTVDVPAGTDIAVITDILSLCTTHLEYACPSWYAKLLQCQYAPPPTNDDFVCDQWALNNVGQVINFGGFGGGGSDICGDPAGPGTPDADIDAPEAWSLEPGGGIVVAVIDTGADMDHPELLGKLVSGESFVKGECSEACHVPPGPSCPNVCEDTNVAHGTFIAGIIAATTNNEQGIAAVSQGALVMPLRAFDYVGFADIVWIKNALMHAANPNNNVRVINMSWRTRPGSLEDEITFADAQPQKLMVAAAGECIGNPPPGGCSAPVSYPASDPRVMAVTSTNFRDERSCFASLGPELSVAAPGAYIVSTWNPDSVPCPIPADPPDFYCMGWGTSFSAPYVAGLAALVWSVDPSPSGLTDLEVRRIIQGTADDLGATGHDDHFGCGRINAFRAVSRALGAPCAADVDGDCVIGILDFLGVLFWWGPCQDSCCSADVDFDGGVGISDFLAVLGSWGPCATGCPPPLSLAQEIAAAGLTQQEWDTLQNCVVNGTPAESANCVCWMEHYMDCHRRPECAPLPHPVTCPGADPLGHH